MSRYVYCFVWFDFNVYYSRYEKVEKRCKNIRSHFNDMTSEQKMIRKDWINKW